MTPAAALLLFWVLPASAEEKLPTRITEMRLGSGIRLASDTRGRIATYEECSRRVITWDVKGKREKVYTFDANELSGTPGMMGFSNDRVLFHFHDGGRLLVLDTTSGRITARGELPDVAVYSIFPSRDGWVTVAENLAKQEFSYVVIDTAARQRGVFLLPQDALEDAVKRFPSPASKSAIPLAVGPEIWLVGGARYVFWRPAQRGKGEYSFFPPACLAAEAREVTGAENEAMLRKMLDNADDAHSKAVLEHMLEGAKTSPGGGFISAVASAASLGDEVGVLVREKNGSADRCRLDVWDLEQETLRASLPVGETCPGFLAFNDSVAWYADRDDKGETYLREISLPDVQVAPSKDPCDSLKKKKAKAPSRPGS